MTLPDFRTWATATGLDLLKVDRVAYRKVKEGVQHEFLEVVLVPDSSFTIASDFSPLTGESFSYDFLKNLQHGLRFRIDRGQRKATPLDPPITRTFGHRFAVDMVELMDHDEKLDSEILFVLQHTDLGSTITRDFLDPRVCDIIFALERAQEALGPSYTLNERNCWTFASFVFQVIVLLFDFSGECDYVGAKGPIRSRFFGSKISRQFLGRNQQPDLYKLKSLLGVKKDMGVP